MKYKQPQGIDVNKLIGCRELLKNIHVPKVSADVRGKPITYTQEQAVLIKIILGNDFTRVDVNFIVKKTGRVF